MSTFPRIHGVDDQPMTSFPRTGHAAPALGPPTAGTTPGLVLQHIVDTAIAAWKWIERRRVLQTSARRLRVTETVSLGEKRFVSIVQVDGAQYLIGGATGSVSLLAILNQQPGPGELHQAQGSFTQEQP